MNSKDSNASSVVLARGIRRLVEESCRGIMDGVAVKGVIAI